MLIVRNSLPIAPFGESEAGTDEHMLANQRNLTLYLVGVPLCAALAVPLWAALEVIYWVGNYFLA